MTTGEHRPGEDATPGRPATPVGGDPRRPRVSYDPCHFDRLCRDCPVHLSFAHALAASVPPGR